jgi:hypothetical protein
LGQPKSACLFAVAGQPFGVYHTVEGLLDGKDLSKVEEGANNVIDAYRYFYDQLEGMDNEQLDALTEVILGNLPLISIELDERDDEQEIFDTINSTLESLHPFPSSETSFRPISQRSTNRKDVSEEGNESACV